ncbi:MAG: MFS transporter [Planctomycetes bacterium]|jgi:ATP-dependent protease HslVU (ClpYQ) peptidase subunit|nr:MFS transporter [Planctomycetota bacterium]MDP6520033.1 MFS transporter [Planctomycetota bacterium]
MTTTIVVAKDGQACIAADTLARYGSTTETADLIENHDKLLRVGETVLAPCGPASAQLLLRSYFADPEHLAEFSGVDEIYETVRRLQAVLKDEYYLNPKEDEADPFDSLQMECLLANPSGIYGIYPLRSIQAYRRYYAFGSGAAYALGAMHARYESAADAQQIARVGLEAAAALDDSTAAPFTLRTMQLRD